MKTTIEQNHIEVLATLNTKKEKTIFLGTQMVEGRRMYSNELIAQTLETSVNSVKFYVKADGSLIDSHIDRKVEAGMSRLFSMLGEDVQAEVEHLNGVIAEAQARLAEIRDLAVEAREAHAQAKAEASRQSKMEKLQKLAAELNINL